MRQTEEDNELFSIAQLNELETFRSTYLERSDGRMLNTFVARSLQRFGFTIRKFTVSQKIPTDWRERAEAGAFRVRQQMLQENVEVLVSADEFFLRFHEQDKAVAAPIGIRRVGSALSRDEKIGLTAVASMEMFSSRLLPPFVIFKGELGATLMKRWQEYTNSTVHFTSTHWMTKETCILYIKFLIGLFPNKKIGLVWDKAPQHFADLVLQYVDEYNKSNKGKSSKIVMGFIDPSLTSIYQPPDVVIIAIIKRLIRQAYHAKITEYVDNGTLIPGDIAKITREDVVDFLEKAYNTINKQQEKERSLAAGFEKCGLNFRASSQRLFEEHLQSLDDDGIYRVLSETHTAMELATAVSSTGKGK